MGRKIIICLLLFSVGRALPQYFAESRIAASPDTISIHSYKVLSARPAEKHRLKWNRQTTFGTCLMVFSYMAAWHFHREAENSYRKYLRSGSYKEIDKFYQRTQKFDKLTGWAYFTGELGFIITVFSFDR